MALTDAKPPVIKVTGPLSSMKSKSAFDLPESFPPPKKPPPILNLKFDEFKVLD